MGLVSRPSPGPRPVDASGGIRVMDVIDMKESLGTAYAPGVVVVLDSFPSAHPQGFAGRIAQIRTPSGHAFSAPIEAVRDHLKTISFFFRGLTSAEIPIGSCLDFED
jgi:hypothetical protein